MKAPTCLYHADGSTIVIDAVDVPEYIAKGYRDTPAAFESMDSDKDGAVTREELEQKAKELGLSFDGRTTDKKLLERIEAALNGNEA